ncbi:hypothetical protein Y032_0618g705 [Ancylostoma ceylanicum]|uniref:Uncharacterized protein n=1 Tax=Ancylostoma ceylanicum TaxID=53326 RepID=A0A016UCB6_9BILA|nr:hypothetical protein Y032_0047g1498 [Ancylostoma ceylanicum]EYC40345.1 hypothetical protein Y032_0618g705 [Ancylostoma ceylanicum]
MDPTSSPSGDLDRHAQALVNDDSLSAHLKAIISFLLKNRRRLNSLMEGFRELNDDLSKLRAENEGLRNATDGECSPALLARDRITHLVMLHHHKSLLLLPTRRWEVRVLWLCAFCGYRRGTGVSIGSALNKGSSQS